MKRIILIALLLCATGAFGQWNLWDGGSNKVITQKDTVIDYRHPETGRQLLYITGLTVNQQKNLDTLNRDLCDSLNSSSLLGCGFDLLYIKFSGKDSIFNLSRTAYHFTTSSGVTFRDVTWKYDGSSGYTNTGYNPSINGINVTQNSASLGVWSDTNSANSGSDIGCRDGSNVYFCLFYNISGRTYSEIMQTGDISAVTSTTVGLITGSRTSNSVVDITQNGVAKTGEGGIGSATVPNLELYIGARNGNGTATGFTNRVYRMAFVGKGFTDLEMRKIYNCFNKYFSK